MPASAPPPVLEKQIQILCQEQRNSVFQHVMSRYGQDHKVDSHTYYNVMYYLKDQRGLSGEKPDTTSPLGKVHIDDQLSDEGKRAQVDQLITRFTEVFDQKYHLAVIVDTIIRCMGSSNQDGKGLKVRIFSWLRECLAPHANFPCPTSSNLRDLRRTAQQQGNTSKIISYKALEKFFKLYDSNYQVDRQPVQQYETFYRQCKQHPVLRKMLAGTIQLAKKLDLPVFADQEKLLQQQLDTVIGICIPEDEKEEFDQEKTECGASPLSSAAQCYLEQNKQVLKILPCLKTAKAFLRYLYPITYTEERQKQLLQELMVALDKATNTLHSFCTSLDSINGETIFRLYILPIKKNLHRLKQGHMSEEEMKDTLLKHAEHIIMIPEESSDLTVATLLEQLEGEGIQQWGKGSLEETCLLSNSNVKRALVQLLLDTVTSFPPYQFDYYITRFHQDVMTPHMFPMMSVASEAGEEEKFVYEQTEGVHPLFLLHMLVCLGGLEYQDTEFIRDAFDLTTQPIKEKRKSGLIRSEQAKNATPQR